MSMLETAIMLATKAHAGQVDKCGEPYILHPLRVMMTVQGEGHRTVAVLHDVLEDTSITDIDLLQKFPLVIVEAVKAITKTPKERNDLYIQRVMQNPIARIVKIADVKDNASPSRLYRLDPATIARLTTKYSIAMRTLEGW